MVASRERGDAVSVDPPRPRRVRKAVIPVAGLGTRFLPATKAVPKEMLPLIDKPIIQYVVESAVASGIEEVIFVTAPRKTAIEDHFEHLPYLEQYLKRARKLQALDETTRVADLAAFVYVHQQSP